MTSDNAAQKNSVRWLPFQCPSCFGLFRAKRNDAGEFGRCPGCEARLLIPELEKKEAAHKIKAQSKSSQSKRSYAVAGVSEEKNADEPSTDWDVNFKKRKRFAGDQSDKIDWEEEVGEASSKSIGLSWPFVISVLMLGVLLAVCGIHFIKSRAVTGRGQQDDFLQKAELMLSEQTARNESMTAAKEQEAEDARRLIEKFDDFNPMKVRQAIEGFLSSTTYEEKANFSRGGQTILPKIKDYYENEALQDEGFRSIDQSQIVYRGNYVSTFVRLDDFLDYPIVVEKVSEDLYLVDWESWVGYGEKKVSELILTRPTEPVFMRAVVSNENYYNYTFSDDAKWLSLKLSFRNQERSLWAYVDRDSDVGKSMKINEKLIDNSPLRIKIKYPENARANDQVIITEIFGDGWVDMTGVE